MYFYANRLHNIHKRCIFINAHIKMLYFNKENTKTFNQKELHINNERG